MALTKADISEHLFNGIGISKRDTKEIVELYFEAVCKALESGQQVKLSGFGNFELHDKNERPGRNPKTGEPIPVSARRVVTFRSGQKLRARVEVYAGNEVQKTSSARDTE
ncbi:MAG TPA: integration host factor subunit alpha [Gammaproteobacteria bacterium]|nr:integration host factor subunit alpha [Gammaproteobacteria bacterium]